MNKLKIPLIIFLSLFLFACYSAEPKNTIRVGTIAGPETQIMKVAANVAKKKYGLDVVIVIFTDYKTPNEALSEGDIDANMFQQIPYLNAQIKAHGYKFSPIGKVFVYPMGLYSNKIKSIANVPEGAKVGIPDDATGKPRALLLMQAAGLITLKNNKVVSNPKNLKIEALNPVSLPKALSHLDLAAINTNYAIPAGYYPSKALFLETANSAYVNVVVVRTKEKNEKKFKELIDALHSQSVLNAAKKIFGAGAAIPAWKQPQPAAP